MPAFSRRDNPAGRRGRPIRTGRADRPVVRPPSVALRVAVIGVLTVALVGMIVFRLWFLQILSGEQYVVEANDNRLRAVKVLAPRGSILDRDGEVIVDNRPGLAVGIRPMDVPQGEMDAVVVRVARAVHVSARRIRARLTDHTGLTIEQLDEKEKPVGFDLIVVKEDVTERVVSYILEHKPSFPGVEVRQTYLRHYPQGDLAAHLLGYLGEIDREELRRPAFRKYEPGDIIGKTGVEYTYDRWLRGVDGSLRVEVDAHGVPKGAVSGGRLPEPGDNLVLSLDSRIQRAAEQAVRYGIDIAHVNEAPRADAGAAVVLDARSGEVVAMASYPAFDPDVWVGGISPRDMRRLLRPAAHDPLLNRATQGQYAIGSTFKVIDAVAGLEEGEILPSTSFTCGGSYTPPETLDKSVWRCWSYPAGHGAVSLETALTESCDVYFYNVGMAFYRREDTALADWAVRLGLGHTTGLDIPGEYAGRVPTPKWRRSYFKTAIDKIWKPGNSINLAIGQGDLLATPLQTAVAYAAIANGGYVVRPHLGVKVVDGQGRLVQRLECPKPKKLDINPLNLQVVQEGLRRAASDPIGTSSSVFGAYRIPVAGKTGTAEVFGKGDYSWYASYAPVNSPRYVVVVMIEQGGHGGSAAAPAARKIYDALFNVRAGGAPTGSLHGD